MRNIFCDLKAKEKESKLTEKGNKKCKYQRHVHRRMIFQFQCIIFRCGFEFFIPSKVNASVVPCIFHVSPEAVSNAVYYLCFKVYRKREVDLAWNYYRDHIDCLMIRK